MCLCRQDDSDFKSKERILHTHRFQDLFVLLAVNVERKTQYWICRSFNEIF